MSFKNKLLVLCGILSLMACGSETNTTTQHSNTPIAAIASEPDKAPDIINELDSKVSKLDTLNESDEKNNKKLKKTPVIFSGKPVNLNTASTDELVAVLKGTGIGEAKVKNIVAYREQHHGFKSVDELLMVKGIGEKTLQKAKDRLFVE